MELSLFNKEEFDIKDLFSQLIVEVEFRKKCTWKETFT